MSSGMLADSIMELEFDMREDEPWYDQRDLQQDLQLAATLGKTLLDRNAELEESLQQMYNTNQEQLQEIEYLTKQLELLRQTNDQHAKVYEQLDLTARDLEENNQKLVLESRTGQQRILGLTETIESLQAQVDDLQRQVEELKKAGRRCRSRERFEQSRSMRSISCLKELYDLRQYFVYDPVFAEKITSLPIQPSPLEDENEGLRKTLTLLKAQLGLEKKRRETMEEEYNLIVGENSELEQRLCDSHIYRARAKELETEVAEMRQICQSENRFRSTIEQLAPESFITFREPLYKELSMSSSEEFIATVPELDKEAFKKGEQFLSSITAEEILNVHEETCARRAEAVKQRGISLLNEVDAQYSALKVKYEELLHRCHLDEDSLSHKAVQTSKWCLKDHVAGTSQLADVSDSSRVSKTSLATSPWNSQPEYKALFQEIFNCINKTKEEIREQRTKFKYVSPPSCP
ncbi:cerebellar degeneration-related protein 2 [Ambystoma mexicanum]|uniref:cerebellar degeneration-related protein 2 n=1 Tax=Ambystoma mexicanum TaxID=8296 RepID=UPI0037E94F17